MVSNQQLCIDPSLIEITSCKKHINRDHKQFFMIRPSLQPSLNAILRLIQSLASEKVLRCPCIAVPLLWAMRN